MTTEYEYEGGVMIKSITVSEPLWTDADLAEQEALVVYRASLCPCGCGWPRADTTSQEGSGPDFTASRVICRARLAMIETEHAIDDGKHNPAARARLWTTQMHDRERTGA